MELESKDIESSLDTIYHLEQMPKILYNPIGKSWKY